MATSKVTDNTGAIIEVENLSVPVSKIYNFVTLHKKDHFGDHSLEFCLEHIIDRGIAEITRQIKTAQKLREDKAAGSLLRAANLTPKQAMELLQQLQKEQAAQAKAQATK